MLRYKAITVGFLASMLLPLAAHAQGGSQGSILGYVFDQTGNPIKGVKVLATSPTQIGGSKTGYTNEEGFFRFNALFPGTFEVRASAPKLKTVIQKELDVVHERQIPEYHAVLFPSTSTTNEVFYIKAVVGEPAPVLTRLFADVNALDMLK